MFPDYFKKKVSLSKKRCTFTNIFKIRTFFVLERELIKLKPEAAERMVTMVICPSPKFKHSWHYLLVSSLVCSDL
jgi:hypothetical protein